MRFIRNSAPWIAVLLSGMAALAHELLWTRRLIDLIGATHEATARVIACFFLGISIGAALTPAILRRTKRPWMFAAIVELAIAVACLPIFFLPDFYTELWRRLGPEQLGTAQAGWIKLAISALLVVPPALLMGLTLPLMVAGIVRNGQRLGRGGIWLYALNTVGGVAGILLSTYWALGRLGVRMSIGAAMALNVAAAMVCLLLHAASPSGAVIDTASTNDDERDSLAKKPSSLPVWLAFFSGMLVLAFEILCLHLFSHVVTNLNATTTVLAAFIFVLFVAAACVPILVPGRLGISNAIPVAMSAAATFVALTPIIFVWMTDDLSKLYENYPSALAHFLDVSFLVIISAGLGILFGGTIFPLAVADIDKRTEAAPNRWGLLLAANGIGGALGAELANNLLMPSTGLYGGFGAVAVAYAVLALVFARALQAGWAKGVSFLALVVSLGLGILFLPRLPIVNKQLQAEVVAAIPGPDGVITVLERTLQLPDGDRYSRSLVWNSQYTLGGTISKPYERRQVIMPLLLHPNPNRVACLGIATGISAGAALDIPGVEEVVAIELSRQVCEAASDHFAFHNRKIMESSRAKIVVEDARTYIDACVDEFDCILSDFFRPHATGEGRMFSAEHFASVKDALRDGGLFCQWIPCYQTNEVEFEVIAATFLDVFEVADIWRVNLETQYNAYALVGYKDGSADFDGLESRCAALREKQLVVDPPSRHVEGIMMHYVGRVDRNFISTDQRNTLDNLWLELAGAYRDATNDAFQSSLIHTSFYEFDKSLQQRASREAIGNRAQWTKLGQRFIDWRYEASTRGAEAGSLLDDAKAGLPASVTDDKNADWSYWPG